MKEGKIQVQGIGMYDDKTLKKKIIQLATDLQKNAKKGNWNKASENGIRALGRMWGAYQDWARVNEAVYKLKPGSTADDLDELDAALSRLKILGKPNFSKLTYMIDKTKLSFQKARHLDKLMKKFKTKKIHEGKQKDMNNLAMYIIDLNKELSNAKVLAKKHSKYKKYIKFIQQDIKDAEKKLEKIKKNEAATAKKKPSYYKGLSKKDKEERERVIKRRSKMDSDDPDAYKDFRSDKGVKTKPSKYTSKFKQMYGELSEEQKAIVHEKISAKTKKALKNKAKKANAPLGALTQIYNKGLAAWRTGHRPGASQHAWAMGRVNSVLTGGKARKVDAAQWNKIKKHRKK